MSLVIDRTMGIAKSRFTCYIFLLSTIVTYSASQVAYKCGPFRKCKCFKSEFNNEVMKCSRLSLNLSDVCAFVSRESNITILQLSINKVEKIGDNDFVGCERVELVDLSSCGITKIAFGAFVKLKNLKWLDLSLNRDLGFESLNNVSYGLQFTKIDFLNISGIHHKFGLGTILRRQHICYLRNTSLRELAINENRIQQLEINVFMLLPRSLQILHMNDNTFMFGPYVIQAACLNNVTTVYVDSRNQDPSFWEYLTDRVIRTDCVASSTSSCPFDNEHYLLNISTHSCKYHKYNNLSLADLNGFEVPKNVKKFSYRGGNFDSSTLNINKNVNVSIDVEWIDVSGNHLNDWQTSFIVMPNVKYADLSQNGCANVRYGFFMCMPKVKYLNLKQNFLGFPLSKDEEGLIFKPLKRLIYLDLTSNQIEYLPQKIFVNLVSLRILKLSHNGISTWTMNVNPLGQLHCINMSSNSLRELPNSLDEHLSGLSNSNFTLDLTDNPLQVSCQHETFLRWMVQYRSHFVGFDNYSFQDESGNILPLAKALNTIKKFDKTCQSFTVIIVVCTLGLTIFLSVVICGIVYRNRWKLRYFMYMNKNRLFRYNDIDNRPDEPDFKFDAFISYADNERRFIKEDIVQNVENRGLKLCIHDRDFIAGRYVHENILDAIRNSKKTVVILSKSFVRSKWCKYEFQMARMEGIYARDGSGCVIMVLFEHVPMNKMQPEMADMVKNNAYIEYTEDEDGQALFWNKLNEAIRE